MSILTVAALPHTIFRSRDAAEKIAAHNQSDDKNGWTYLARGDDAHGYIVMVRDETGFYLGAL